MEQWAREAILQHNACMDAAYQLVMQANGYCENTTSNRIAEMLENYSVNPSTGDMEPVRTRDTGENNG